MAFRLLPGFWYRYLVDAKVTAATRYMGHLEYDVVEAIVRVLGIQLERRRSLSASRKEV